VTPLFVVDGHHLLYRAWFGFPARITSRDTSRDLTGVFGFLALARKAHQLHGPGHELVVAFDGEYAIDARAGTDTAYKANRAQADHTPIKSLPSVKAALDQAGVAWIELDQHEGDDVIATLTRTAVSTGHQVTCYSGDRDLYQLLDHPGVTILTPARTTLTAPDIHRRYGVLPRQWPDYRALTGDPADNIPGIRGIGPKTAAALLADGWRLDDLPGSPRLHNSRGHTITRQWDQLLTWRDLIYLDTNAPIPPAAVTGHPTPPLPTAAHLLDRLDLW
jgi:5'-3' exonuclease